MNILKLLLAEIRYRKLNFVLSLFAVAVAVALFVAGPMLVDGYQRETNSLLAQWQRRVADSERLVAKMETGMGKVEAETKQELARLNKQTRRLMRDMGFNLMIVHKDTNMSDFWAADFATADMPQEYVDRLAGDRRLTMVTHLVATFQQKITWRDRKVLLVGYLPETTQSHLRKKSPMGYDIESGTVILGHELGAAVVSAVPPQEHGQDARATRQIKVLGKTFRIARILPEQGSKEDITIAVHLDDAQAMLDKPGRINQIMAIGCRCVGADLAGIREQLGEVLPETRITEFRSIALARAEQRDLVEAKQVAILAEMRENLRQRRQILSERKEVLSAMETSREKVQRLIETLSEVITPLVVLAAAVWVGLLALANVRERRTEIGILRALGKGSGTIAGLFIGKAVLTGLIGAAAGVLLGTATAWWLGTGVLNLNAEQFHIDYFVLSVAIIGATLLSAVAGYLPTLSALMQDPAIVLRDQ